MSIGEVRESALLVFSLSSPFLATLLPALTRVIASSLGLSLPESFADVVLESLPPLFFPRPQAMTYDDPAALADYDDEDFDQVPELSRCAPRLSLSKNGALPYSPARWRRSSSFAVVGG